MKMKKRWLLIPLALVIFVGVFFAWKQIDHVRNVNFRTEGDRIQILQDGEWKDFFVKGVNMGVGKPGYFPGEMAVTKKEYARWFEQIADMNANTVRVYTILSPAFYEALFEYNMTAKNPIYLFHGVWMDEERIITSGNAYDSEFLKTYEKEIRNLVDVIHGTAELPERTGHASGLYRWDNSPYIAGYILGIELDYDFVAGTNEKNPAVKSFNGDYLYTKNASPFECFLARSAETLISYEYERYGDQKPVSWTNWLTTDPLTHANEPDQEKEDGVSVDTEHILAKDSFEAGLFASYHAYPYYPEFMNVQPEYIGYRDESGVLNPYQAYLLDLKAHHSVPVLVAEFGVPSSRGRTHENPVSGFHQGGLTEKQQGEYDAAMFDSIASSGYAGGIVFTWQDEWFKRSWNTMDYDLAERRPYWSNFQVSEQRYGLLAFDSGKKNVPVNVDGDPSEWGSVPLLCEEGSYSLSVTSDSEFVYFLIKDVGGNIESKEYVIALDSIANQGSTFSADFAIQYGFAADRLICINGKDNSRVLVDAYGDPWYRQYSMNGTLPREPRYEQKGSGIFNPVNLILSRELYLPQTGETIPQQSYETGKLQHGIGNPALPEYNSLADFCMSPENGCIELRIPWQLLGAADPSTKTMTGDLYAHSYFDIDPRIVEGFDMELKVKKDDAVTDAGGDFYAWESWDIPEAHERLKESYFTLKDTFAKY